MASTILVATPASLDEKRLFKKLGNQVSNPIERDKASANQAVISIGVARGLSFSIASTFEVATPAGRLKTLLQKLSNQCTNPVLPCKVRTCHEGGGP